jgi:hypothetical protein
LKQLLKTIGLVSAVAVLVASAGAGATGAPRVRRWALAAWPRLSDAVLAEAG